MDSPLTKWEGDRANGPRLTKEGEHLKDSTPSPEVPRKALRYFPPEAKEIARQVHGALTLAARRTALGDFEGALRVAILGIAPLRGLAGLGGHVECQ